MPAMESKRLSGPHPTLPADADLTSAATRRVRILGAMRRAEEVPAMASGALLVGDSERPVGMIIVEGNRVCWTAAEGLGRRLREILRSRINPECDQAAFDSVLARCRDTHVPLGETLVHEGFISAEEMRAALKQHTLESLLLMDERLAMDDRPVPAAWPLTWVEHGGRSFKPQFTFSPSEVLAGIGALQADETAIALAEDHLLGLTETGCGAVAFVTEDSCAIPSFISALPRPWLLVEDLLEVAGWALAALDASAGFSPLVAYAYIRSAPGGGAAAWIYEGQTFAAVCPGPESLARLVTNLDNQSLQAVLSKNVSVVRRVRDRFGRGGFSSAVTA